MRTRTSGPLVAPVDGTITVGHGDGMLFPQGGQERGYNTYIKLEWRCSQLFTLTFLTSLAHEANLPEESRGKIGSVFVSRQKDFAPRWVSQPCSRTTRFLLKETFKFHLLLSRIISRLNENRSILKNFSRRVFYLCNFYFLNPSCN